MLQALAFAFLISTQQAPLDPALSSAEPPASIRAAFTIQLTDGQAYRQVRFDPRLAEKDRWQVAKSEGKSDGLDRAVENWGSEAAPDGRLFADDLRASMGKIVEAEDLGAAWRVHFRHLPSDNDGPLDVWAADHLVAYAWLEPVSAQLLRVEYIAPEPFDAPEGGRVENYAHSYALQREDRLDITFIAAFQIDVKGKFMSTGFERSYRARVEDVEFFFASPLDEALFMRKLKNKPPLETQMIANADLPVEG